MNGIFNKMLIGEEALIDEMSPTAIFLDKMSNKTASTSEGYLA